MVGRSTAGRAHQQAGRGLVAAASSTTPSIGLPRIDSSTSMAGEVAEQHRGRPQLGFAERHHREFEREAAGLVDAALHVLGEVAQMRVAGRQLGPGVADADDRPAVEHDRPASPGSSSSSDA